MTDTLQTKKKILIVEDEVLISELYKTVLEQAGYEVTCAKDGEQGFNEIVQGNYDLVLLDIMLPKLDGVGILKKLASNHEKTVKSKILMLTNLDQDMVISNCLSLGASGYFIKNNISNEQLVQEVRKLLGDH